MAHSFISFSQGREGYCDAQRMPNTLIGVRFLLSSERSGQN
jgi:hypothetical protein